MATFNSRYTTSELFKVMSRRSIIHYYWTFTNDEFTFYFVDNRRLPRFNSKGYFSFSCHKANYYRLRNKIKFLPFRLSSLTRCGRRYMFDLIPDSCFLCDDAGFKLLELNERYDGQLVVRVVVI